MSYNQQKDFKLIWSLAEQIEEIQDLVNTMEEAREVGGTDGLFEEVHTIAKQITKDIAENIYENNTKPEGWN